MHQAGLTSPHSCFYQVTKKASELDMKIEGNLQLIIGPMFSGKSTELIRRIHRYQHAKLECLVVKYLFDTRHSEEMLSTHDKVFVEAMPVQTLAEVRPFLDDCDVIGIDEGQFYPDLVEFCQEAANLGKVVVVAALDATFERKAFDNVVELIPTAEKVVKLNAICSSCGQDAAFTRRLVADTTLELIGGSEMYEPRCRQCFSMD